MKKIVAAAAALLVVLLCGCTPKEEGMITGILFERGHGSAWGNQFYIQLCPEEIVVARYFPAGSAQQQNCEHIPITQQQWDELCTALQAMELEKDSVSWWQRLWEGSRMDGTQYRRLIIVWSTARGDKEIAYRWPDGPEAENLEKLLESLIPADDQ